MKKLTIELDGGWVLRHRDDENLPVAVIKSELAKVKGVEIKDSSHTSVTVIYDDKSTDDNAIKNCVKVLFSKQYPEEPAQDVVTFQLLGEVEEVKPEDAVDDEQEARRNELLERMRAAKSEGSDKPSEAEKTEGGVIGKINSLVGAAEFKELCKEIIATADEIRRTNTYEVFNNRCYLFSIGDGYGLSTYLELLAELISDEKLCQMATTGQVRELTLKEYRESSEPFDEAIRVLAGGNDKSVKVLCVDISEWMDRTDNRHFKHFLRVVEKCSAEFVVVFRVPFVDKDILARIQYSLSDLLSVKSVSFPPLSQDEIKTCADAELKRYGFSVTSNAWKFFFERISEEKSDGKFYGVNTVKKVVRELVYQKHIFNAQKAEKSSQITVNDAKSLCFNTGTNLSGMEQLNKLVGVENIRARIEEVIAQIELALKSGSDQRPCIHMRFIGNPGTGKTTVARIIGKILKERGVLRVGAFFEYAGRDFCGRYIGETAPKTASICRDAYGSVLFIDEAYSLYRGDGDTKDFGREAIDTLIAEMENHRSDFVVIMAGYTKDIEKLMQGNLGLASRMPYTIEFPDFTREQLYEVFVSMVNGKFKYDKGLLEAAHDFFINLPDDVIKAKDFANARYVRNLFERTWAKAAMRCQLNGKTEILIIRDDFEHASADKEFATNIPKNTRIGFNI